MPRACYCTKPNQPSRVYFAPAVSKPRTQDKTSSKAVPGGDRKSRSEELLLQRTSTTKPPHISWFHPSSPSSSSPSLAGIHSEPPGCNCRVLQSTRGFGDSRHGRPPPSPPRAGWWLSSSRAFPSKHHTPNSNKSLISIAAFLAKK